MENADSIKVTFADGNEVDGTIRQTDQVSGMAMVSVRAEMLNESTANSLSLIPLGNSYSVRQGDPVIAVGAPGGIVHSSAYGFISYIMKNVQVPDGMTRLLLADIRGDAPTGTFLLNLNGQMIPLIIIRHPSDHLPIQIQKKCPCRRRIWESVDRKSAPLWRRMECLREFTWQTVSRMVRPTMPESRMVM